MSGTRHRAMGGYGPLSKLCAWGMRLRGWQVQVIEPMPDKCVIAMYPHTSNWDFPVGLATKWAVGLTVKRDALRFAGKESLFVWPWGVFFRSVGGFPVKRTGTHGFVEQMAKRFAEQPRLRFVLAPEGTRKYTDHMRSSFYYVAKAANVPIILGAFDFATKRVLVDRVFWPTDDVDVDLATIKTHYESLGTLGHSPEKAAPWVFKSK